MRPKSVGTRRPREGNSAKWSMAANPGKSCANVRSKVHRAGALYLANVRRIASLTLVGSTKKRSKRHTDRLVGCRISSRAVGSKVNTLASRGHAFGSYAAAASADASRMGLC